MEVVEDAKEDMERLNMIEKLERLEKRPCIASENEEKEMMDED